jgi:diaminobutyrate-2-oxoglutarate transaminase
MSTLTDENGKTYVDFFAGAGALNYGHNNDYIKERLIAYLAEDGLTHALDMFTEAKRDFLTVFTDKILEPRGMDHKVAFCGPTGTNAVEAALKLARKVKKRSGIFAFTGSFHGMTMGSAAVTSSVSFENSIGVNRVGVTFLPYPFGFYNTFDTIAYMEEVLKDDHSGVEKPAAVIVETVQCEGGICVAPTEWLKRLRDLCDRYDILLIVDDIQAGCGRAGTFFSFERAGIMPDMVILSKSISGYGLPMALLLLRPNLDIWAPAEHNGTFRGVQLALIGARAGIEFRESYNFDEQTQQKGEWLRKYIRENILPLDAAFEVRGLGLVNGIDVHDGALAKRIMETCFANGLILERAGRNDEVVKLMPPLVITQEELAKGAEILKQSFINVLGK